MAVLPPEIRRLMNEIVRAVRIPYAPGFNPDLPTLPTIVRTAMGTDVIARKQSVRIRLQERGIGKWVCSRKERGKGAFLHAHQADAPGLCVQRMADGTECGLSLRPADRKLDEFAEAFGFLERSTAGYIRGKFGFVSNFLSTSSETEGYFDSDRANKALSIYALLERHGDFVLPTLCVTMQDGTYKSGQKEDVKKLFKDNLERKLEVLQNSKLRSSQALYLWQSQLNETISKWVGDGQKVGDNEKCPCGSGKRFKICQCGWLVRGTRDGYVSRTVTYLTDLMLMKKVVGARDKYELTALGQNLCDALRAEGMLSNKSVCSIPATFEAVSDNFGVTWQTYSEMSYPPITHSTFERVIMRGLLPNTPSVPWSEYSSELRDILPHAIRSTGDKATRRARIENVRLALFVNQIGTGRPTLLGSNSDDEDERKDRNVIFQLAVKEPNRYSLGRARSGRYFSIALLRS